MGIKIQYGGGTDEMWMMKTVNLCRFVKCYLCLWQFLGTVCTVVGFFVKIRK